MSESVLSLIGNTPLAPIRRMCAVDGVRILAKLEVKNPGGSIKDRVALAMVEEAEARGELNGDRIVLEATSGNTGIGLAMVCAVKGYRLKLLMPENASEERKRIMRAYGAEIELTPGRFGTDGAIEEAYRLAREDPDTYVLMDQYNNPASIRAHYEGTGKEIWEQTGGRVTHVVATLGTTGTAMGITKRMREMNPDVCVVAVEPFAGHKIQGLKNMQESYPPGIFDRDALDRVIRVEDEEAFEACRRLASEEGLFAGMSAGAAMAGALKLAEETRGADSTIVVIFPDGGERYLSTPLFAPKARQGVKVVDVAVRGEKFLAPEDGSLRLFTPGPGLDVAGDVEFWRRFVFLDVLAKFLASRGVEAGVACGLADLDDRAVAAAREAGVSRTDYAQGAVERFKKTADTLKAGKYAVFVKASDHLDPAVAACEKLMNKGLSYEKLRSVYFDTQRDKNYGEVAGQDAEMLESCRGAESTTYLKDHPRDFTLLKRAQLLDIKEGEFRQTRWGNVRPSWFLQMASAGSGELGSVDVVVAAEGQRFPHLDNLRAVWRNSAGFSPQAWMVVGEVITQQPPPEGLEQASPGEHPDLNELLSRGLPSETARMWLLSASYHKPLIYSGPTLLMWTKNRDRVQNLAARLAAASGGGDVSEETKQALAQLRKGFREAVENDLSLYKFWPALFEFCRDVGARLDKGLMSGAGAAACLKELEKLDEILGILDKQALPVPEADLPREIVNMLSEREKARAAKDFAAADALREGLKERGWRVEDGSRGSLVYKSDS